MLAWRGPLAQLAPRMTAMRLRLVYSSPMPGFHVALLGLLVVTTTACESCRRRGAPTQKTGAATSASALSALALPPLQAPDQVMTIALRGHADAELLIPIGATTARPLVALLLSAKRSLRQECETLGQAVRREAFVLCQSTPGDASDAGLASVEGDRISSALKSALHATKRKFGQYVASKELALVGIGIGAEAVAPIVRAVPDFFHRVGMLDAGFRQWTSVDSVRFVGAGGKAMLVRCTAASCRSEAMRVAATVKATGIATRLEPDTIAPEATFAAAMTPEPSVALAWLIHAEPIQRAQAAGPSEPKPAGSTAPKEP